MNPFEIKSLKLSNDGQFKILHYRYNGKKRTRFLSLSLKLTSVPIENWVSKPFNKNVEIIDPLNWELRDKINLFLKTKIINYTGDL